MQFAVPDSTSFQASITKWVDSQFSGQLRNLQEAVNLSSFSLNVAGVNRVQALFARQLEQLGLEVSWIDITDRGCVIEAQTAAVKNNQSKILLVGHSDTVHPEDQQKEFSIVGNKIEGDGAYDMKAGDLVILHALKALKEANLLDKIPLKIVFNSAEENSTVESRKHMQSIANEHDQALVFEFGRKNADDIESLVSCRKGLVRMLIEVKGLAAHAGNNRKQGKNAILAIARRMFALEAMLNDDARNLSFNPGIIEGGVSTATVPDHAQLACEMRAFEREHLDYGIKQVREVLAAGDSVDGCNSRLLEPLKYLSPLEKNASSMALIEAYISAAAMIGLEVAEAERSGGLSDANQVGQSGAAVIDALGPYGGAAHTKSEWVSVKSFKQRTAVLIAFLLNKYA